MNFCRNGICFHMKRYIYLNKVSISFCGKIEKLQEKVKIIPPNKHIIISCSKEDETKERFHVAASYSLLFVVLQKKCRKEKGFVFFCFGRKLIEHKNETIKRNSS